MYSMLWEVSCFYAGFALGAAAYITFVFDLFGIFNASKTDAGLSIIVYDHPQNGQPCFSSPLADGTVSHALDKTKTWVWKQKSISSIQKKCKCNEKNLGTPNKSTVIEVLAKSKLSRPTVHEVVEVIEDAISEAEKLTSEEQKEAESSNATTFDSEEFEDKWKENPELEEIVSRLKAIENEDENYDVVLSDDKFNKLRIYKRYVADSKFPVLKTTMEIEGVSPKQIADVFSDENIEKQSEWSNAWISCEMIIQDKYCNIYKTLIDCQILANREFIDKKYWYNESSTNSYFVAFTSANDHPDVMVDFAEDPSIVRGTNYLGCYILRPLDDGREGTRYLGVHQGDFGGSIPSWIVNMASHKATALFAKEIISRASMT